MPGLTSHPPSILMTVKRYKKFVFDKNVYIHVQTLPTVK